jgi:hypothetical protein
MRDRRAVTSFKLTPLMQKRLSRRAEEMIESSLPHFPELEGRTITVGYTRRHLGSATVAYRNGAISRLIIRLKVRKLTYQTVGHELTHLVQALAHAEPMRNSFGDRTRIPSGEKPCDIWTLARHEVFCDDPPTYLRLPRVMRELWPRYAAAVRALCMAAIDKRKTYHPYIQWLETEIRKLAAAPVTEKPVDRQLKLPFLD